MSSRVVLSVLACLLSVAAVLAQEVPAPKRVAPPLQSDQPRTVLSITRRFAVSGLAPHVAVPLARWVEDIADRTATFVREPLPLGRSRPLEVRIRADSSVAESFVIKAQGYVDGQLEQKLIVVNAEDVDQEDMVEGLCWLLLNRYVVKRQTVEQRNQKLGEVPDWLAAGVAQNLYREMYSRNTIMVVARWRAGDDLPFADVLQQEYLPPGRWFEKAVSSLAVSWLQSLPDFHLRLIFDRLAAGQPIDAEWIARDVAGLDSVPALEKAWDLWVAQRQDIRYELGTVTVEQVEKLKQLLEIVPMDYGIEPPKEWPMPLVMADLVDLQKEPAARSLAQRVAVKFAALGVGQGPEFQDVVRQYLLFLDAVQGTVRGAGGGLLGLSPTKGRLLTMLAAANIRLEDLENNVRLRRDYMDGVEASMVDKVAPALTWQRLQRGAAPPPSPEMRKYLDEIESRFTTKP